MKRDWVITKVDGKISAVGTDFGSAAKVLEAVACLPKDTVGEVTVGKIDTQELFALSETLRWEDLRPFGSKFRLEVWKALFDLTHDGEKPRLYSYSDFASAMGKGPGVRAVAHAIGLNPINVIVPCHLIIPKESLDRLQAIQDENGLFSWKALYIVDSKVDYGEYALGPDLKRDLIRAHLG
ncbi:MAG: methylated-DNA--[Bacteroidales bacterium]|nr:methylated-DNA--[protein]-cysteine S-methyltransferase [Bacteroidales bacterium]